MFSGCLFNSKKYFLFCFQIAVKIGSEPTMAAYYIRMNGTKNFVPIRLLYILDSTLEFRPNLGVSDQRIIHS